MKAWAITIHTPTYARVDRRAGVGARLCGSTIVAIRGLRRSASGQPMLPLVSTI